MHELSIAISIIDICKEETEKAGAKIVTNVELEIGSMSGVEIEALEFAWEAATRNSVAEGSELIINRVEARARCRECGHEFDVDNFYSPCPVCDAFGYEIFRGQELKIRAITVE